MGNCTSSSDEWSNRGSRYDINSLQNSYPVGAYPGVTYGGGNYSSPGYGPPSLPTAPYNSTPTAPYMSPSSSIPSNPSPSTPVPPPPQSGYSYTTPPPPTPYTQPNLMSANSGPLNQPVSFNPMAQGMMFNVNTYRPRALPLTKDDQPLPTLITTYPDRPPYVIDVSLMFAWSSFKPKGDHHDIPCALMLNAPDLPFNERSGVDIICVIDVSGSMEEDNKLNLVKKTLNFMIGQLNELDRLCIISFNNTAMKLMPLTLMNNSGKIYAATVTSHLRAGGGTNIIDAVNMALTVALNRNTLNYTLDIMILSDGVDSHQESSIYRARTCFGSFEQYNMSYSIHAFGYGHEHDSELLGEIAHMTNGGFYYIEESEDIRHAFSHCLGEVLSVVARDIKVALVMQPCPIPFNITKVHSECGTVNFRLPNLSSGHSKEAIFILSFPPTRVAIEECMITPVKAFVSFVLVKTGEILNYERDLTIAINHSKNVELYKGVMIHFYRVKTSEALRIAGEMGMQHRFHEGRVILDNCIHELKKSDYHRDPLVKIFIRDLENSRHKLKDHGSWRRGGHAHFRHAHHGHWAKRGEKNDMYMNRKQIDMRNAAGNYF